MSVNLSPIGNGFQFFTTTGLPLAGGYIYTYQAGSTTALSTYTDPNALYPNTNPIQLGTDGRPPQEIWLLSGYNYKFVLTDSLGNTIQTYDNLYGIIGAASSGGTTIPSGLISLWSGSIGSIPMGWLLCDGTNGTPNLKDRFIVGAGSSYSVGQTGGSTDAVIVSHTHTATSVVTDPGHNHTNNLPTTWASSDSGGITFFSGSARGSVSYGDNPANTGITVATTNQSTGVSGSNANLPPYYALAYIMKT